MSYKSAWFTLPQITRIAKHFDTNIDYLLDRGNQKMHGAYGCNVRSKLNKHPLFSLTEIDEYMEREHQRKRISRPSLAAPRELLFHCTCGWTGKGTGRNGALIESDRCPDCGIYL